MKTKEMMQLEETQKHEVNEISINSIEKEYIFTPTLRGDGIIDYTSVKADKIFLSNKKTILSQDLPSYLPPVEIRRDAQYDIPAYKVKDNEYLLRESDVLKKDEKGKLRDPRIFLVSLDVYAALVNYHLEYDRAAFTALAKRNEEARLSALDADGKDFKYMNEKSIPVVPGKLDINALPETFTRHFVHIECKPSRVSFKSTKSRRMNVEPYYYIQKMSQDHAVPLKRNDIFRMHKDCLEDVKQKLLDMELQKADFESSWTKGRETAYGDNNLDNSLLKEFGVTVKRQNGNIITAHEIDEVKTALEPVHSIYGDISGAAREFGLKVSHAGNMRMHASKYVGLFSSYHNAIGISFADGISQASLTASHEYAHFLDHLSGREAHAWHASDIPGTLENSIAVTFREHMNPADGDYWNRTCECFARAMEEYTHIGMLRQDNLVLSDDDINKNVSKAAHVNYHDFKKHITPLTKKLVEQYRERFAIETEKTAQIKEQEPFVASAAAIHLRPSEKTEQQQMKGRLSNQLELFESASEYLSREHEFYRKIDEYLERGITPSNNVFMLTHTPEILQYSGIDDNQIVLSVSTLNKARKLHGLSNEEIRLSLQSFSDPLLVFDSDRDTSETERYSNLVLIDSISENKPIAISVELEKETNQRFINEIWNIHDRELVSQNGVNVLEEWANKGLLKYVDDKKISDWQKRERAQFPLSFTESVKSSLQKFDTLIKLLSGEKARTKSEYIRVMITEYPEKNFTETDPALTRDHIRAAKAAMREYVKPVLSREKSGLWKSFRNFKTHGVFSVVGASVETDQSGKITDNGWKQMHQALNIYRDKRFETFRVLFVSPDGKISDQLAISSHLPNCVNVSIINTELKESIIDHAQKTNTKIVLVHNHPSGNINPSPQDEHLTESLTDLLIGKDNLSLVQGHIILDHDSFSLYEHTTGWNPIAYLNQTHDPLMKKRNPAFTREKIGDENSLCKVARHVNESKRWNSTDWVPILFADGSAKVSGIRFYSKEWLINTTSEKVLTEFQSIGLKSGAIWAFPIVTEELAQDMALKNAIQEHMKRGCFRDYYMAEETAENAGLHIYGGGFFNTLSRAETLGRTTTEATFDIEAIDKQTEPGKIEVASKEADYSIENTPLFRTHTVPTLFAEIDRISKEDIGKVNSFITITEKTPFILQATGLPEKQITMYRDKLARALYLKSTPPEHRSSHGHSDGLSKDIIQKAFIALANPYYVFASKDRNSMVGVYDITDKNDEPVIIAFRHKNNHNTVEANWITSLYGKNEQGIERWAKEGLLRYVNDKEKAAELTFTLQMRVKDNSAAYNNIARKTEIVNAYYVKDNVSEYGSKGGNTRMEVKEALNSPEQTQVIEQDPTPKKPYSQVNAERFLSAIKDRRAPFLVHDLESSTVTILPKAVRSAETGRTFRGMNQLLSQIALKEIGSKDVEIITYEQAKKHEAGIKRGSQGLHLTSYDAEERRQNVFRYYPVSAVYNREKLPNIPTQSVNRTVSIYCKETTPEKYLGKYLAATSLGARFETSRETMDAFRNNLIIDLEKSFSENHHTRIFEIGNKASEICRETMSEVGTKARTFSRLNESHRTTSEEPYNPVTGEKFLGTNAGKATYLMEIRQSKDPRFLELTDILKTGLSLKKDVKEPLVISVNGKSRFFYNAVDIDGMPPKTIMTEYQPMQNKTNIRRNEREMDIGL